MTAPKFDMELDLSETADKLIALGRKKLVNELLLILTFTEPEEQLKKIKEHLGVPDEWK